ncbi:hypothetical protein GQ43DRAFT_387983, partial [Delitschia confertaspora ATCC 74209]
MTPSSLLFFGPQLTKLNHTSLADLQSSITTNPGLRFLVDAVTQLPLLWPTIVQSYPRLAKVQGEEQLEKLCSFVQGGDLLNPKTLESNILIAPLTVLSHIVGSLGLFGESPDSISLKDDTTLGAVQGFCIGFLSAAALSSSCNLEEFKKLAAITLRLAVCIGAVVDLDQESFSPEARHTSVVIRWSTDAQKAILEKVLAAYPAAYISCVSDQKNITVTLPLCDVSPFALLLAEGGMSVHPIGLHGRFHNKAHLEAVESLKSLCDNDSRFQLPTDRLILRLRSTSDGEVVREGDLHHVVLSSILTDQAQWFQTVNATVASAGGKAKIITVGSEGFMPRSIGANTHSKQNPSVNGTANGVDGISAITSYSTERLVNEISSHDAAADENAIAVVGMACRFPRADSLEEFWQLLSSGLNAVGSVPEERFKVSDLWREPKGPFFGNFLNDADAFDNRFFNISSREAKSMDPQQRLFLQVAYEALESSGYFAVESKKQPDEVGCYVGVGSVDYEDNVASENATAFSATGSLRAFISGRVSHHFGWSGPSITFDTACSSSAVAIHSACKALQAKECTMAIAGGVNVITSPKLFQNLGAGRFLNPTGASRAFDTGASGYCRGEGSGVVVLKPLACALAEDDMILGVIAGSAVNQGSNCSPITVPDSTSQSTLYRKALSTSGAEPWQVSYVEAHGTGTPVGDPIEYESIRTTFAGEKRKEELFIGSVKDNIGHAEAASGAAGLVKTLLMIQNKTIPKQANFTSLNPKIVTTPGDQMSIPKQNHPWASQPRVAVVNNYGAAGSNAAIIVKEFQDPQRESAQLNGTSAGVHGSDYPFIITARSPEDLQSYCTTLESFISRQPESPDLLPNLAYNLARKHNRSLEYIWTSTASNITDLRQQLGSRADGRANIKQVSFQKRPVVLCFGGQNGTTVNLSEELFYGSKLLQSYLTKCDYICRELGLPSLFPRIFLAEPVDDIVHLHCMLFALQYATAKSWLDSGLEVDTLIGHSFGQLTALCVADCLSVTDTLRLISGRARLIQERWGPETGAMLSVEGDREDFDRLLDTTKQQHPSSRVDICCYNGPRNFVLAGTRAEVEAVEDIASFRNLNARLKLVRLKNTHAYHSYLTEDIMPGLKEIAESLRYQKPSISIETCSQDRSWSKIGAEEIVQHTRTPVYFSVAVQRVAARLPSAIWLEAGSASSIIAMTRRVFRDSSIPSAECLFLPTDFGSRNAQRTLAATTSELWAAGSKSQFWSFHRSQKSTYTWLNVPPYQFEKSRHWIQYKTSVDIPRIGPVASTTKSKEPVLLQLHQSADGSGRGVLFTIDPEHPLFNLCARGHAVLNQSLCPASMYIELVLRATRLIDDTASTRLPQIEHLEISSPLGLDTSRGVFLRLTKEDGSDYAWKFSLYSGDHDATSATIHASGKVGLLSSTANHFRSMKRLIGKSRCDQIRQSPKATGLLGQALVYKAFSNVVDYASYYRGVQSIFAQDTETVGHVFVPENQPSALEAGICDPIVMDNFLQVSGIHVNCLSERKDDEVFMCTSIGEVSFTDNFLKRDGNRSWTVYSNCERPSKGSVVNDIFILDSVSGDLVLAIIACQFRSVPFKFLHRVLSSLNAPPATNSKANSATRPRAPPTSGEVCSQANGRSTSSPPQKDQKNQQAKPRPDNSQSQAQLLKKVQSMLSEVMEIDISDIKPDSPLEDLGIDSLMQTEVLNEINKRFNVNIPMAEFQVLADIRAICKLLQPDSTIDNLSEDINDQINHPESQDVTPTPNGINHQESDDSHNLALTANYCFRDTKNDYDTFAAETGFTGFCSEVYPAQAELVVAYIVEAFRALNCPLESLRPGEQVPRIQHIPQHTKVVNQLYTILEDAKLVARKGEDILRTETPVLKKSAKSLSAALVERFPQHASEHKLLDTTGHKLADCLTGKANPLSLLFGNAAVRSLLTDVYTNAPMFKAGSLLLAQYLTDLFQQFDGEREIKILELGAGTGGTTKLLADRLAGCGRKFSYTFTDLSSSLVAAAKKKFSYHSFMKYTTFDIEKDPEPHHLGHYDIVISTNCIHATRNLVHSTTNIKKCLRSDGILCLVELTRNLFWFDLVFGLVEGWWLFNDDRKHVLADEHRWDRNLKTAGFQWVDWSDGRSEESNILRVITASSSPGLHVEQANGFMTPDSQDPPVLQETVLVKQESGTELFADIYYPEELRNHNDPSLPVALMIHGGGHVMLSRKDIRLKQTQTLLAAGFLPISVDYRLCPEMSLREGPMHDVSDALKWARSTLPSLSLKRSDIRVNTDKIVAVGWSTGGHLAMTLAWTSKEKGIEAPNAILAFYCPTDYEDEFWRQPNIPEGSVKNGTPEFDYNVLEGVYDKPIIAYNPPPAKRAIGGWMAPSDPRSRIALHMNWEGKTVDVLVNGLKKENHIHSSLDLPKPTASQVAAISPLAQTRQGNYKTPTFIIHGTRDDLIPWEQAQRTYDALKEKGVEAEIRVLDGAVHLFDLYRGGDEGEMGRAVEEGYEFLRKHV